MIRILKRIKHNLLAERKFKSYFMYAFGEIILIVAGILIALAINNQNLKNTTKANEKFYLSGLKTEFEESQRKLQKLIEVNKQNYENSIKIASFIQTKTVPKEKALSKLLLESFAYEIAYNPNNSIVNELINTGNLKTISNAQLRYYLTSWESRLQSIYRQESSLRNQRERVVTHFLAKEGSIKTIMDDTKLTDQFGLQVNQNNISNLSLLNSSEFENNLLLFILTAKLTEENHYTPLLKEIDTIISLIN